MMNSRNVKKKFKLKIFKVMKLTFKIILSQLLLRITFHDRFRDRILIFYIWVPNLTIDVIMKNNQFKKNILLLLIGLDQENHGFRIPEHLFRPLYYACTQGRGCYLTNAPLKTNTYARLLIPYTEHTLNHPNVSDARWERIWATTWQFRECGLISDKSGFKFGQASERR